MKKVAVVDYGMGNLRSVTQAVMHVAADAGVDVVWARTAQEVMDAERVVLPGQGAMRDCMHELHASGMFDAVMHAAAHKPLMGVCVGMQMLLDYSEEQGIECLGLIPGRVVRFELEGRLAGRRQPLQGAANGLEPGLADRRGYRQAPPRVGRCARWQLLLLRAQLLRQTVRCAPQCGRNGLRRTFQLRSGAR